MYSHQFIYIKVDRGVTSTNLHSNPLQYIWIKVNTRVSKQDLRDEVIFISGMHMHNSTTSYKSKILYVFFCHHVYAFSRSTNKVAQLKSCKISEQVQGKFHQALYKRAQATPGAPDDTRSQPDDGQC
jgi:hypothetical protein